MNDGWFCVHNSLCPVSLMLFAAQLEKQHENRGFLLMAGQGSEADLCRLLLLVLRDKSENEKAMIK